MNALVLALFSTGLTSGFGGRPPHATEFAALVSTQVSSAACARFGSAARFSVSSGAFATPNPPVDEPTIGYDDFALLRRRRLS